MYALVFTKKFLLIFIFFIASAIAYAQTGTIKGTVKTSDGKPAEFVTISLNGSKKNISVNQKGSYQLNRVAPGTYTLTAKMVGFASQSKVVEVRAGEVAVANFMLNENNEKLQEVVVNGIKTNKFAIKKSDFVARLPLKNLENPQVYTAVPQELLTEQIVVDFKESLRNVPGVVPNNNPAGGTGGTFRGFTATTTVRNGMAVQSYQSDPINLERVEVIKGPSGTLFGSSIVSFGGLINQVTKKPYESLGGEVSVTLGKYELSRITADVNTSLNSDKTALLRINAATHRENSFQNFGYKRMITFAPTFLYKASDRLTFTLEAELNKTNRTTVAYHQNLQNVPGLTSFRDIPIDFNESLSGANLDAELSATNVLGEARYKISDQWSSSTNVAYGENQIDHSHQIYPQWNTDAEGIFFNRSISSYGPRVFTSLNLQQNFTGDINIGNFRNRAVVGVNFYNFRSFLRFTATGIYDKIYPNSGKPIPAINLEKVNALMAATNQSNTESTQSAVSVYVSDVFNVTDRLSAMLSLRADRFTNGPTLSNGVLNETTAYEQTAYSPKLGLVYQVVKDKVSLFGNYMNGFQNVAPVTRPGSDIIDVFKPRQANQWEGGAKFELFDKKLNATFSYYDIGISKDTRIDNGITIQDATSKSNGFEAELITNPVAGLNIIAGFATNDYKILKAAPAAIGKRQAQVPDKYANLWVSYKFMQTLLRNFGLGIGANHVSSSYFDAANTITLPGYTLVSATIFYDQPKWRIGLKGNNVGDVKYWSNWGIAETRSQYLGSVTFKF
ncbi:TonB-dependent receptor [Desertivirga xinjiangensis]|uniref:TonB-dependent receptor n=1 Tax=Desertivirga xinjiangensis TaxID=539206 RepID=UPI00210AC683|nr:TonB-dependent receptor [Pedobacter xinjiangensis]